MNKNNFKSSLSIALFKLLSLLPLFALRKLGRVSAFFLWHLNSTIKQIAEINIALCFSEKSQLQQQVLVRDSLIHYVQTILEIGAIWCWPLTKRLKLITRVSGKNVLAQALSKNNGVIVLTPHLGNWEVVGDYLAQQKALTVLYAPSKLKKLDQFIFTSRSKGAYQLAPTEMKGVKALMKALKKQELVGILPDQVPDLESGMFVPFFGQSALTMTLVNSLLNKTGAEVICAYAKRLDDNSGFELCFRQAQEKVGDKDQTLGVTALNATVESCVNDCPEQYLWAYKRFRKRPVGEEKAY